MEMIERQINGYSSERFPYDKEGCLLSNSGHLPRRA